LVTGHKNASKKILITGAGSVGKRHAQNFQRLGISVDCVDPRPDRRTAFKEQFQSANSFARLSDALSSGEQYTGAVICSPTSFHVAQASDCVARNIPVLMEKPLSVDLHSALNLKAQLNSAKVPFVLGYTWRWWPALESIRAAVISGKIGRPYYARFNISAHLADWHPWEDYRDFFMAQKELGGGALLDESHWIDQMIWLFGMPHSVFGVTKKLSNLEITSDDLVDLIAFYNGDLIVSLHLDLFGRPHDKTIQLFGEDGNISWSEERGSVRVIDADATTITEEFSEDRNHMFEKVAEEFLQVIGGTRTPRCIIDDGIHVLEVVEAIRESQRRRLPVPILRNNTLP